MLRRVFLKRPYSATNLARKPVENFSENVELNPKQTENVQQSVSQNSIQNKLSMLTSNLPIVMRFFNGPVRNNFLISREVLRIIAKEQQIIPSLQSWPQARQAYVEAFSKLRHEIQLYGVGGLLTRSLQEATWGQFGLAGRKMAELASFYYIGQFIGQVCGFFLIN